MYGRVLTEREMGKSKGVISPWWYIHGGVSGEMNGRGITPSQVIGRGVKQEPDGRVRVFVGTVNGSVYELGEERR